MATRTVGLPFDVSADAIASVSLRFDTAGPASRTIGLPFDVELDDEALASVIRRRSVVRPV